MAKRNRWCNYSRSKYWKSKEIIDKADVLFCLDFNHKSRVGPIIQPYLENNSKGVVVIDHHTYPQNFGDLEYIDSDASSTCELVYQLIESNNDIHLIDEKIGQAYILV